MMKKLLMAAAFSAATLAGMGGVMAAPVHVVDNIYTGDLAGNNSLGPLDLADGSFVFSGIAGAKTGSLVVDLMSSAASQATGAFQFLVQASKGATIVFDTLKFAGVDLVLVPITGGWSAAISGPLPSKFELAFSSANKGDSFQVTVASVPVPAAGFLLVGALGGLGALRRRKSRAA